MSTKILQRLTTLIAILLVIPLTVLSVIACVTNARENENEEPTVAEQKPVEEGMYRFDGTITLKNVTYFVTKSELYAACHTKDMNGVNEYLKLHGFDDFVNNLTKVGENDKFIQFKDNKASSYTKENDEYTLVNENEFEFTYDEETKEYTSTGTNPIIKNNAETKTVTLYFPFHFETEEGTEITPVYVEATLVYVEAAV